MGGVPGEPGNFCPARRQVSPAARAFATAAERSGTESFARTADTTLRTVFKLTPRYAAMAATADHEPQDLPLSDGQVRQRSVLALQRREPRREAGRESR